MSNIEEDIKRCEKLIEPQNANWIGITNQLAIAHLIEKVKELRAMCEEYCPKTERIKELEEENADLKIKNNFRIVGSYAEVRLEEILKNDYIPKQKVKDKIEELKKENDLAKEQLKKQCEIADERNNLLVKVNRLESQIDLMAEYIANRDNDEDICTHQVAEWCEDEKYGVLIEVCRKCIKQYFERKVEE